MRTSGATGLSTPAGIALYVGALLGPSLLLLPGLAARIAGPASLVAWLLLLALSGLLAWVFMVLGRCLPGVDGVVGYARAGFGPGRVGAAAARVVGWCFLAGVVLAAPLVCLIGAGYVADLVDGGSTAVVLIAGGLLAVVLAMTMAGRAVRGGVQLGLVAVLVALVVVAVPTAMFVTVYAIATAAAVRLTAGATRVAAGLACSLVVVILGFSGWALLAVAAVAVVAALGAARKPHRPPPLDPAHPELCGSR